MLPPLQPPTNPPPRHLSPLLNPLPRLSQRSQRLQRFVIVTVLFLEVELTIDHPEEHASEDETGVDGGGGADEEGVAEVPEGPWSRWCVFDCTITPMRAEERLKRIGDVGLKFWLVNVAGHASVVGFRWQWGGIHDVVRYSAPIIMRRRKRWKKGEVLQSIMQLIRSLPCAGIEWFKNDNNPDWSHKNNMTIFLEEKNR